MLEMNEWVWQAGSTIACIVVLIHYTLRRIDEKRARFERMLEEQEREVIRRLAEMQESSYALSRSMDRWRDAMNACLPQEMTDEMALAELRRAAYACYPERAEEIINRVERRFREAR